MYILDKNIFLTLGNYYPKRFPTIWERLNHLVQEKKLWSVKEVKRELDINCPFLYVEEWVTAHKHIFRNPTDGELRIVAEIFKNRHFQTLVKRQNLLKGLPVADPFIVASAKANRSLVVTQEKYAENGVKIPNVCKVFDVEYINMEQFLEKEKLLF